MSNDSKIVKSVRVPANVVQTGFEPQVDDEIRRALKKMIINYEKSNNLNVRIRLIPLSCIRRLFKRSHLFSHLIFFSIFTPIGFVYNYAGHNIFADQGQEVAYLHATSAIRNVYDGSDF